MGTLPSSGNGYSVAEVFLLPALLSCAEQAVMLGVADPAHVECEDGEIRVASTGAA